MKEEKHRKHMRKTKEIMKNNSMLLKYRKILNLDLGGIQLLF
jgi:hypothetical protein